MADLSTSFNPSLIATNSDAASSALSLGATVSNVASAASSAIAARTDQSVKSAASPAFVTADLTGITDGNVPYISAGGFADSPLTTGGGRILINAGGLGIAKLGIAHGTDSDTIVVGTGVDNDTEYFSLGIQTGYAVLTAGGVGSTSTALVFKTANAGTEAEQMRILANGTVKFNQTACFDAVQTATGDGTTTIDWGLGNKFYFTFGAQADTFTFTAPGGPCNLVLVLKQDGTGSRLATWPNTVMWPAGTAPTLSTGAAAIDIVCFFYDGTNYFGQSSLNFSVPA
jgi:hypothetical protein